MITKEQLVVGQEYRYPTPGGRGQTVVKVLAIHKPGLRLKNSVALVYFECDDIGWGAMPEIDEFCRLAELIRDP